MILFSSRRQRLIAEGLLAGLPAKEIAYELGIAKRTVTDNFGRMYAAAGLDHRVCIPQIVFAVLLHNERPDLCCTCNPALTRWIKACRESNQKHSRTGYYTADRTVREWTKQERSWQLP